jgi:hypothetical protein
VLGALLLLVEFDQHYVRRRRPVWLGAPCPQLTEPARRAGKCVARLIWPREIAAGAPRGADPNKKSPPAGD